MKKCLQNLFPVFLLSTVRSPLVLSKTYPDQFSLGNFTDGTRSYINGTVNGEQNESLREEQKIKNTG